MDQVEMKNYHYLWSFNSFQEVNMQERLDPPTISNKRVACVTCVKYERLMITVSNAGGSC